MLKSSICVLFALALTALTDKMVCASDPERVFRKRLIISLGTESGVGKADVRLTWPTAEQRVGNLRGYYDAFGSPPEYLCLVGFPDLGATGLPQRKC